jgi:hypothetical protein
VSDFEKTQIGILEAPEASPPGSHVMTEAKRPDLEARLREEVERAVAPYVGRVPPMMVEKLREQAERYWRERPEAMRALQMLDRRARARSGTEARLPDAGAEDEAAQGRAAGGTEKE